MAFSAAQVSGVTTSYALAESVGRVLQRQGQRLAAAESCTGGWFCQAVTSVPGSSDWFDRGFITYSNEAKVQMLGVGQDLLDAFGAVSEEVVQAMVAGALSHGLADCAVAISGIAGPGGAVPGKPVGTVWLAWQRRDRPPVSRLFLFDGDREQVRAQAVEAALGGLLELYGEPEASRVFRTGAR